MASVTFFAPTDPLGLDDWEIQSANPTTSRQRAQALKANGDELAYANYGEQTALSLTYKANRVTGDAYTLPKVGAVLNGYHVDSVQIAYTQTDFPTLTVSAHTHGSGHTHDECRTYSPTLTLPARAIGVPTFPAAFTLPSGLGMRSATVAYAVNHVDENDADGGHLAADNYDGTETLTVELTGDVTEAEVKPTGGWEFATPDSFAVTRQNTAATTATLTFTHHLAHDES